VGFAAAAGAYGYATGDGTTGQRIERGLGFATATTLGMSKRFRGAVSKQWNTAYNVSERIGVTATVGAMGKRAVKGMGGTGRMAAAGAIYGAFDEDTSIIGGAVAGAGIGILGKGAIKAQGRYIEKNIGVRRMMGISTGPEKSWMTMRHGAAAGGAVGMIMGGPVGMVTGAGIGGMAGGIGRFAHKYPKTSMWAGGTALVGGMSTAMVAGAASNAQAMHRQLRDTNFGATGDLALGLHSLRHG